MKRLIFPALALLLTSMMPIPASAQNREHQQMTADVRMLQEQTQQLAITLAASYSWPLVNLLMAWVLTLPAAGLVGALMEEVTKLPAGDLIVFLLAGTIAVAAFVARRYETRRLVPAHA